MRNDFVAAATADASPFAGVAVVVGPGLQPRPAYAPCAAPPVAHAVGLPGSGSVGRPSAGYPLGYRED